MKTNITRALDNTYGFIYKVDENGNGKGLLHTKTINNTTINYLTVFGDVIISAWEKKVTTPIIECIQLADDSTTFIKSYESGLYKNQSLVCDDSIIVDSYGKYVVLGGTSGLSMEDIYEEILNEGVSFEPKQFSSILKSGYYTEYDFYLNNVGDPVIFKAVYDVIENRMSIQNQ
jgi:hypothetical protein